MCIIAFATVHLDCHCGHCAGKCFHASACTASTSALYVQQWLAAGSEDKSFSIWPQGHDKPKLVLRKVFDAGVSDIAWAPDGSMVIVCSFDGSVQVVSFDDGELGTAMEQTQVLDQSRIQCCIYTMNMLICVERLNNGS
jgi:WD40 repeat protein